jgi:hypothetical protein
LAKLNLALEELLSFRSTLQKKFYKERHKGKKTIHCMNDVTDFILEYVQEEFPQSQVSREKFILELLWSTENHKCESKFVDLFSRLLLGQIDHQAFMFLLMCREHVISVVKKIYAGK